MGRNENDTLESMIRIARAMNGRRGLFRPHRNEPEEAKQASEPAQEISEAPVSPQAQESRTGARSELPADGSADQIPEIRTESGSELPANGSADQIPEIRTESGSKLPANRPANRIQKNQTGNEEELRPGEYPDSDTILSEHAQKEPILPSADAGTGAGEPVSPGIPAPEAAPAFRSVGIHFLEFVVAFLTLTKCHYQQATDIKVNSLPFFTLIALDSWADEDYTMSDLANKLQITRQQFSRLINDLEEKGLVERIHDTANRRRVYIRICEPGRVIMNDLKQAMLTATLDGLRSYSENELADMDRCLCRLTELMEKFNSAP